MSFLEMGGEMDSKPLEKGSVESKMGQSQNPCGQNLEEASGVSNFAENCKQSVLAAEENGSGNNGGIDINGTNNENVEVSRIFGSEENGLEVFENKKESLSSECVSDNNHIKIGFLGSNLVKEILVKCEIGGKNKADGLVVEDASAAVDNDKDVTEEAVGKIIDEMQLYRTDSSKKIEASVKGISLFVEVFGPSDGICESEEEKCIDNNVSTNGDSDGKSHCERNGTLSSHNSEDTSAEDLMTRDFRLEAMENGSMDEANEHNEAVHEDVGNEERNFVVGDLVWVKTKTKLWWPGLVSNPSNASKDAEESKKKDCLLVKYFGNANYVWCCASHVKHFLPYFEEMSQQNNSRSFYGAIERAVSEVGRYVKEEMTCSCFRKESERLAGQAVGGNSVSKDEIGELRAFSVSQFQPADFVAFIKYLALEVSLPDKIKLTVTRNCLSTFYHSLGHYQLPMHQLRPTDTKDQNTLTPGRKGENLNKFSEEKSNFILECGGAVDERERFSSTMTPEIERSSSFESPGETEENLLNGDNSGGRVDGRSEKGNESRERKKSKYLSYPYINPSGSSRDIPNSDKSETEGLKKVSDLGMGINSAINSGSKWQKGFGKSSCGHNVSNKIEIINSSSVEMLSELLLTALDCWHNKERRHCGSVKSFFSSFRRFTFLNHEVSDMQYGDNREYSQKDNSLLNTVVSECQGIMGSDAATGKKVSRRRKKAGPVSGLSEIETIAKLPDLNANNTTSSVEGLQVAGDAACQGGLVRKKRKKKDNSCTDKGLGLFGAYGNNVKFVQLLKDVEAGSPNFLKCLSQQNNIEAQTESASEKIILQSEANASQVHSGSPMKSLQQKQILSPGANPERKRRKRKQKAPNLLNNEVSSSIPDLNGNVADSSSPGNYVSDVNSVSPKGKLQRRRRRKGSAAVPDNKANQNKVQKNVEFSGAIRLNFTPGFPLPSVESLLATFSGYGALRKSETKLLDGSSAQVVFVRCSAAAEAFQYLQKNNPFGSALAGFRFHQLSAPEPSNKLQMQQPFWAKDGLNIPATPSGSVPPSDDPPDLLFIKQNLQMMTSKLEKAGNNLSPEMRAKLESEIKAFTEKFNSMVGSLSS